MPNPVNPCDICKHNPPSFSSCGRDDNSLCMNFPLNYESNYFEQRKTNADIVKEMCSVELANFLYWCDGKGRTNREWLEWLREEAQ